jgi:hypothetical protein
MQSKILLPLFALFIAIANPARADFSSVKTLSWDDHGPMSMAMIVTDKMVYFYAAPEAAKKDDEDLITYTSRIKDKATEYARTYVSGMPKFKLALAKAVDWDQIAKKNNVQPFLKEIPGATDWSFSWTPNRKGRLLSEGGGDKPLFVGDIPHVLALFKVFPEAQKEVQAQVDKLQAEQALFQ